jgi:hypothetical protein
MTRMRYKNVDNNCITINILSKKSHIKVVLKWIEIVFTPRGDWVGRPRTRTLPSREPDRRRGPVWEAGPAAGASARLVTVFW